MEKKRPERPSWDHSEFTNPTGKIVFAEGGAAFVPGFLPPSIRYDRKTLGLMIKAERRIAELKGIGSKMSNPHMVIRLGLKREAVLSSRIEGTTATLDDLNLYEVVGGPIEGALEARRLPEIINYVKALEEALESIQKRGKHVDLGTIRAAHKTLMSGVRGQDMDPGKFRTRQNWIIRRTASGVKILYTPPPADAVPKLLDNLVEFVQAEHDDSMSPLVQCAVAHYQFEAIHPFLDGNGRVGRLLIPLMLHKGGIMPSPLLYPSAYFERHKQEYYNALLEVSKKGQWRNWIAFFLSALVQQAEESIELISRLAALEKEYTKNLAKRNARANAARLMEYLFYNPYTTVPLTAERLGITYPTARATVTALVEAGILKEIGKRRRNRVFYAGGIDDVLVNVGREMSEGVQATH